MDKGVGELNANGVNPYHAGKNAVRRNAVADVGQGVDKDRKSVV